MPRSPVWIQARPSAWVVLGLGRLLRMVDVLQHHGGAGQADLALLTVGDLLLSAGLDDFVIGVREGDADGALAVIVDGRQATGGDALGGAVTLADVTGASCSWRNLSTLVFSSMDSDHRRRTHRSGNSGRRLPSPRPAAAPRTASARRDQIGLVLFHEFGVGLRGEAGYQDAGGAVDHQESMDTTPSRNRGTWA